MQTFLPYESFESSAEVIDKKRCWKQVVEAAQIIDVLEGRKVGWANHPAVKMWVGHTPELKFYFNEFLHVSKQEHGINTKYEMFELKDFLPRQIVHDSVELIMPWWMGNEDFHRAMRARLIEKDRDYYLPLFPDDEGFNNGKYFWPVMELETFRII